MAACLQGGAAAYWHPISAYAWDQDKTSVTLLITGFPGADQLPAGAITVRAGPAYSAGFFWRQLIV